MENLYHDENISRFYRGFKNLSRFYDIEKVHQLINSPGTKSVSLDKKYKPFKILIMTTIPAIILTGILLWNTGEKEDTNKDLSAKNEISTESKNMLQENMQVQEKNSKNAIEETPIQESENTAMELPVINGNDFIVDLEIDELRELGFQITDNLFGYRNMVDTIKILTQIHDDISLTKIENGEEKRYTYMDIFLEREDLTLYNPDKPHYWDIVPNNLILLIDDSLEITKNDFYPVFCTGIFNDYYYFNNTYFIGNGLPLQQRNTIHTWLKEYDFESQNDTLVPVKLRISRPSLNGKYSKIFWFTANDSFFNRLPDRYKHLEKEYKRIIDLKKNSDQKNLVSYDIEKSEKSQLFPTDSVIDGRRFFLYLTEEEQAKLGIVKDEVGRYLNILHCDNESIDYRIRYWTNLNGDLLAGENSLFNQYEFKKGNDIRIPVYLENLKYNTSRYIWLSLSEDLWKRIPERYQYLKKEYDRILFNKSFFPERDFVKYFYSTGKLELEGEINFIELSTMDELKDFGFYFRDDYIYLPCKNENEGQLYFHRQDYIEANACLLDSITDTTGFHIVYITDVAGNKFTKVYSKTRSEIEMEGLFNQLVPIYIPFSEIISPAYEDQLLWVTPTETLFKRLPKKVGEGLKSEWEYIIGISDTSSNCEFFEECKSTLSLLNFRLYPNPAIDMISISFEAEREMNGDISLIGISGTQLGTLRSNIKIINGKNSFQVDLSNYPSGIYVINISTAYGFKTQRLVINR